MREAGSLVSGKHPTPDNLRQPAPPAAGTADFTDAARIGSDPLNAVDVMDALSSALSTWNGPRDLVLAMVQSGLESIEIESGAAADGPFSYAHGASTRTSDDGEPLIIEPLTRKESEVLSHLADLLTTDEIAEVMWVSVNTVRTHVRNILRKLLVSRRNEAVRRAREIGLIQPCKCGLVR